MRYSNYFWTWDPQEYFEFLLWENFRFKCLLWAKFRFFEFFWRLWKCASMCANTFSPLSTFSPKIDLSKYGSTISISYVEVSKKQFTWSTNSRFCQYCPKTGKIWGNSYFLDFRQKYGFFDFERPHRTFYWSLDNHPPMKIFVRIISFKIYAFKSMCTHRHICTLRWRRFFFFFCPSRPLFLRDVTPKTEISKN